MDGTERIDGGRPKRRWRPWHFILIGIVVLAAFVGILFTAVLTLTRPVVDGGDSFMTALRDGNYDRAYAMATPALQQELGGAQQISKSIGAYRPATWSWSQRSIRNGIGQVSGSATYQSGATGTARLELHQVGGQWRVAAFDFNP